MGEIVLKMRQFVEATCSDPTLGGVALIVRGLLTETDEEGHFEGFSTRQMLSMLDKRNYLLKRRNIDHGGFDETIKCVGKQRTEVDGLYCVSSGYFLSVWIDPDTKEIIGIIYVKQVPKTRMSRKEFWEEYMK